ncbi:PA2778 family cysteine peptidase [Azotobacter vinelandii]|uniref:PA2778 family cysteine peptidase n=1 Tax=Azotobacter vinelandii TaxID=354 RepID=UPI000AE6DE94|nr:PA2778 family cysteine peptidase [Azotobacter vinelandii]
MRDVLSSFHSESAAAGGGQAGSVRNAIPAILLFGLFALLSACTRTPVLPAETASLPERVELTGVPFYPQSDYQGGPAALASMLNQRGLETSPGLLRAQLQHLDREEAMATELEAAARRLGMQVFPLAPRLESVLVEVAAGNPVLVLQHPGLSWRGPSRQFAVVIGFDRRERQLVLRSGTTRRLIASFADFDRGWAKGGRWAVLTLPADRLPATAHGHP